MSVVALLLLLLLLLLLNLPAYYLIAMPSPVDDEEEESEAQGGATVGSFADGEDPIHHPAPLSWKTTMLLFRKEARTTRDAEDQCRIQACIEYRNRFQPKTVYNSTVVKHHIY